MSDVINGVSRELLERSAQMIQFCVEYLCATNSEESDIELAGECVDELRALLTAQPQPSAAQSAPAGEREAFEAWAPVTTALLPNGRDYISPTARLCWETWQAGAAWQRSQSAPVVPEGELPWTGEQLARAWYLAEYGPGHDLAPGYAVAFARELAAMLAAAPQPTARDWPDDEIVSAWKWCEENGGTPAEFLSHSLLVKRSRVLGRPLTWREAIELTAVTTNMPDERRDKLLAIDDEPEAGRQEQGDEVRRLREALEEIRRADMNAPVSESNAGCIKRIKQIAERALAASAEGKA